ncbi:MULTISPECIES: alpha/beta hydrolase family protein [Rhodococcus]|uniref:alpha/beta hydrolase n=1 Tax=Rhodococcus TaxID=1827 RepID=UPI000BE3EDB1|nr:MULTISPECIES: alpha/beta hydrolase family protein [Rhodococcus]MBP1159447.1 S-formylglutathione hydrolase FrmB [Rhodococcus sp. PvR099]MCZ4556713.1 alpha/beta hydrolase family protein [Rhodococcus maanshanensis]
MVHEQVRCAAVTSPRWWAQLVVLIVATSWLAGGSPAAASPDRSALQSGTGSYLDHIDRTGGRQWNVYVHSAAMDRTIQLEVIRPADTSSPRPTLYLLNGAGGGEDAATWQAQSDAVAFFADKNVNVVTPVGGKFSYYTDWQRPDPALGVNKWTTFLTRELPPIVDATLGANGRNAIAGLSTSGSAVLTLAEMAPSLYRGAAAFSGCAHTSAPPGRAYVELVVGAGGGATTNMWGPYTDPDWVANDAYLQAERLRGIALYISNRTGLPGPHDTLDNPRIGGNPIALGAQVAVGGVIEAATDQCTRQLADRLAALGIPATVELGAPGSHSWGYWQDDLHASWQLLSAALGA